MKYRRKPVEIEAFTPSEFKHYLEWPEWALEALINDTVKIYFEGLPKEFFEIESAYGIQTFVPQDYIALGVFGEVYGISKYFFNLTYEKVEK